MHLLFGLMLLVFALATSANDFSVQIDPPPPWNTTEPVVLTLTIENKSDDARRYGVDFIDFGPPRGLVRHLFVADDTVLAPFECHDIGPTLGLDFIWCLSTVPILAGETRSFAFNVVAFPDAVGFETGRFQIRTMRSDFSSSGVPIATTEPILFAYGVMPYAAVPSLNMTSIMVLVLLLAMMATMYLHRYQGTRSCPTTASP